MKKFIIVFLLLVGFSFAQEQTSFSKAPFVGSDTTIGEINGNFLDLYKHGKFYGLLTIHANYDSVQVLCSNDSLIVFPEYQSAGNWVRGDTLKFYRTGSDSAWTDSTTIITTAHKDWSMQAHISPGTTGTVPTTIKQSGYQYFRTVVKKLSVTQGNFTLNAVVD